MRTDEMVPLPWLKYVYWHDTRPDPAGIRADGPPLYAVSEVSAWRHDAEFSVFVRGPMLCKDGHRGPSRGVRVDLSAEQPDWLAALVADAKARLTGSSEAPR